MHKPSALSLILFGFSLGIIASSLHAANLGSSVFPDVAPGTYYDEAVGEMYVDGIITGYQDGRFGPSDFVTRGQVAVMMKRFRDNLLGEDFTVQEQSSSSEESSSSLTTTPAFRFTSDKISVNEDRGTITISVVRSGGTSKEASVDYGLAAGSASVGADYENVAGTINFGIGQSTGTFDIEINDDGAAEENETLTLILENPTNDTTLGSPNIATLTILDNDSVTDTEEEVNPQGIFRFEALEYEMLESGSGINVTVVRETGSDGEVSISYDTRDDTADFGTHYEKASGTLTFASGEDSKSFSLSPKNNTSVGGNRKFTVSLSQPIGGATIDPTRSTVDVVVADDEVGSFGVGKFKFLKSNMTVSETDGYIDVIVDRVGGTDDSVTIDFTTAESSAKSDIDYTKTSGTMTFTRGQAQKFIRIPILTDDQKDANEIFFVDLSNPGGGATLEDPTRITVEIY